MAKKYGNHTITTNDLIGYEPISMIASGDAWDGKLKRLTAKVVLQPVSKLVFLLEHKGKDTKEFATFAEAVNAYNEL